MGLLPRILLLSALLAVASAEYHGGFQVSSMAAATGLMACRHHHHPMLWMSGPGCGCCGGCGREASCPLLFTWLWLLCLSLRGCLRYLPSETLLSGGHLLMVPCGNWSLLISGRLFPPAPRCSLILVDRKPLAWD